MLEPSGMEGTMENYTPDFSLNVQGVKGYCPAGEVYAKRRISEKKIPVLSCEGPCIRGEIARLAANLVAQELPSYARVPCRNLLCASFCYGKLGEGS
jgi:hypothetical protein